jgi:hypothetical protein
MAMPKIYLGDGVFIEFRDTLMALTVEDGGRITDRVVLDLRKVNTLIDALKVHLAAGKMGPKVWQEN